MNVIREFLQTIRENWKLNVLGKRLRDKKGRYIKGRKIRWK